MACAGSVRNADTPVPQPDRQGLQAAVDAFDAGWNAHDPAVLTAMMTDDAVTVTPFGNRVEGQQAHRQLYASDGPTKQTQSKTTIGGIQWLADDLVLLDLHQKLEGPGVEQLPSDTASAVLVLRWDGGDWKSSAARPYVAQTR